MWRTLSETPKSDWSTLGRRGAHGARLTGIGYVLGGLIFGVALFRARVLARWAALLLALSTVATAALAVLPESFNRPMAVPEGVALIALGISLWRDQRNTAAAPVTQTATDEQLAVR